jgi:hypothetical protein
MFHSVRYAGCIAAVAIIAAIVGTTPVLQGSQGSQGETDARAVVGSWLETVTFPPESGRPPLQSLSSYHDDHTAVCSDQGNVTVTGDQPGVFSACHGAWKHLEKRKFAGTFVELISDLSGNLVGYLRVRSVFTVSESGNEYSGSSLAEVLDPGGNVLFGVTVTNAGRRIQVQLP